VSATGTCERERKGKHGRAMNAEGTHAGAYRKRWTNKERADFR
jgi:hypothetical protein